VCVEQTENDDARCFTAQSFITRERRMGYNNSNIFEAMAGILMEIILTFCLYRQWFRYSVKTTLAAAALLKAWELCTAALATGKYQWILGVVSILIVLLMLTLMRKGTRRMMLIVFMLYAFIYNMLGVAVAATLSSLYGAITKQSNQTWFVAETMTQADYVIRCIGIAVSYAAAIWLCCKCVHLLDYLREREKWIFSLALFLPDMLFILASRAFITSSDALLAGFFVNLYGIYSVWLCVFLAITLLLPLRRLQQENIRLEAQMQAQYQYYQKVLETQQKLREVRHDMKNRLVAETISRRREEP